MATLAKVLLSLIFTSFLINGYHCENGTRIVGGNDAVPGNVPYIAALLSNTGQLLGAGSIIGRRWILTAAHVISPSVTHVRIGSINYNSGGVLHTVAKRIKHSDFDPVQYWNDIGLLKLGEIIFYNTNAIPIKMPTINAPAGLLMRISGWGQKSIPGSLSNILQVLKVTTITNAACTATFGSSITDQNICTNQGLGKGACMGDGGGPLLYQNEIHGIIIRGIPCAQNKPDVSVRVYEYRFWIIWTMLYN